MVDEAKLLLVVVELLSGLALVICVAVVGTGGDDEWVVGGTTGLDVGSAVVGGVWTVDGRVIGLVVDGNGTRVVELVIGIDVIRVEVLGGD